VRAPWYLFAFGQTFFVVGDVITYNYEQFFGTELPYPSIGDVAYLLVYPCLVGGLLLLIRERNPGRDRDSVIDSLIVAIGVGTMQWLFLMSPVAHDSASTILQKIVGMAYPFMDLILVTAVVRLASGREASPSVPHGCGGLRLFLTDTVYTYISVQGLVYSRTGYLEAGWGLFYVLWGAAALHPSIALCRSRSGPETRLTRASDPPGATSTILRPFAPSGCSGRKRPTCGSSRSRRLLFVLVVARMAVVRRQEQSTLREKALRNVGASLVTATNRESIYAATLQAARALVGDEAGLRLLVATEADHPDIFQVVAASGGAERIEGTTVSLSVLPRKKRDRLQSHHSYEVPIEEAELESSLGMPPNSAFVLNAPLFMKEELQGLLVVAGPASVPRAIRDSLEALSSQVALALDSALTTEILLIQQSRRDSPRWSRTPRTWSWSSRPTQDQVISPSVERVLGHAAGELEDEADRLIQPEDRAGVLQFLTSGGRENDANPGLTEFRMKHRDDFWLHVEALRTNLLHDENVKGIVLNTRDVSERKAFEEQLQHQAFHDAVTGLANRALFKDRVEHMIERQSRDDLPVSVLFMDLDDFKTINDSLGHAAGDRMLSEVGERLKNSLRQADTAARLGGDEFAILLEDGGDGVDAAEVAARILASLEGPFHLEGKEVFVRASIGIATADARTGGPEGAEELLRNADVAMYMAKEAGKGRYQVFEPAMHDTALQRLELKADLQRALEHEEFRLYYQPVIELATGRIEGSRPRRWPPARGSSLWTSSARRGDGVDRSLGRWVLREACTRRTLQNAT
jgi:diguanylate cyclase (GGDEF)-like protein/PAS domain S-box-containing protein